MATGDKTRSITDLVKRKLHEARDTLIERNLRNRLVNCPLTSTRSRQIRVVDEVPDEVFRALLSQKREFVFAPGRGLQEDDGIEQADPEQIGWIPPTDDISDVDGVARRHRDNALQTQLTAEGLQKRLTSLYYEAREVEEEQGINVLYLAMGFLKWFETGRSELERFAPLVLIPVELTREGARERFKLRARDEDLFTNVSLRVWLAEQHSIQLPDLPDTDDWQPSQYFSQVRTAIANAPRWEVMHAEVLLGFFSFNKFLMWRDLDPKNWEHPDALLGHKVLRVLLAPAEEAPIPEPPVIPGDARVDDIVKLSQLVYVLDADSSQTAAIETALSGRNVVIQGPPGTGKSQTIANIIAAAIARGKTVLFVAEKLAALQVVFERLKSARLGHLCLELHSRKASKQQVLAQLRNAIDSPTPPKISSELGSSLDQHAAALWAHSDCLHHPVAPSGYTPFDVIGRICRLRDRAVSLPDFVVPNAETASRPELDEILDQCDVVAERLRLSGVPAKHPWRDCERDALSPLDQQRLADLAQKLMASLEGLAVVLRSVWSLVRPTELADLAALTFPQIDSVAEALDLAASKPTESIDVLCNPRWTNELGVVEEIVSASKRLDEIENRLKPVLLPTAWASDWVGVRAEIVGSGRSVFRAFRSAYRSAMRTLRGSCKTFPRTYAARVEALDALLEGISLRKALEQQAFRLRPELGLIVDDLPHNWRRAETLIKWLRQAKIYEGSLSVRNPRLLGWSEAPQIWAERLRMFKAKTVDSLTELSRFVALTHPAGQQIEWTLADAVSRANEWKSGIERYNEWPPARDGVLWLRSATDDGFAERCYVGSIPAAEIADRVHLAIFEQLWRSMVKVDPSLTKSDGRLLMDTVQRFRELDRKRIQMAADEVAKKHHDAKPTGTIGDMAVIRTELNKNRRHLPVRKLIATAGHAVQQLKPVFLMSPLSVAQYVAPGRMMFDILLVDEASQIRPADALGAVARANQVVVVGDSKQLPPTNFFNRLVSDEDDSATAGQTEDGTDISAPLGAMESILSLCDSTFTSRELLAWHYRSQHPGLIAVSNRNFYDNKLLLPPSVVAQRAADGLGVTFHKMPSGGYDRGRTSANVLEADRVADAVCSFAREHPNKTLGVGTFSVAQRDAIRARIDARRRNAPELEPFFSTSRPMPFFVKNLENIQGDERDAIFISIGYGRDQDGRLTQNFGPINLEGGERRLNVLISRARERCDVFSSITADDIDVASRKPGTIALREFLQYAEKGYFDVASPTERTFDSDFEESVADFLKSRGLVVHPQVGMAGFYIDLGVIDPAKPSRYLLGIECDGATYHSSRSARDRDRIRQDILESRGWAIYRVWSTDWFHRRVQEEGKLMDAVAKAASPEKFADQAPRGAAIVSAPRRDPEDVRVTESRRPQTMAYREAAFRVNSSLGPHEAPGPTVADVMYRIIEVEGPIHEDEACRRLATVWSLDRAGSRVRDAASRALRELRVSGRCIAEKGFWSLSNGPASVVRDRSQTTSATLRRAEYLPPLEILEAAKQVLVESVRAHLDDLTVEVARRFGFQRTGQDLSEVIQNTVRGQYGRLFNCDSAGLITLVT